MKFVPSVRRAFAVGIALAVVPTTIALASPGHSASTRSGSAASAKLAIYPFGDHCLVSGQSATLRRTSTGGGTWTLAPRVGCKYPKARINLVAALQHNGHTMLGSSGHCIVGTNLDLCRHAAGHVHTLKMGSLGIKGAWSTLVYYSLQGPDAYFYSTHHAGSCKWEVQSLTTYCTVTVDKVTI